MSSRSTAECAETERPVLTTSPRQRDPGRRSLDRQVAWTISDEGVPSPDFDYVLAAEVVIAVILFIALLATFG